MTSFEQTVYDVTDGVATVTMNRPDKLNAWTLQMEKEVQAAMAQAEADDKVRVILLTGAGRGFCAGADLQDLGKVAGAASPAELERVLKDRFVGPQRADALPDFQNAYSYFPAVGKPVIGAINGSCVGLGFVIALYCDIRFASDQARFSTAFSRRGLIAEHGIGWMLPRLVGLSNALELLFSARMIDASEALRMGLVNRVLPQAELMDAVRAYARELAAMVSPRSLRVMKKQVYEGLFQTLGEATDVANVEMMKSFGTADFREGVAHFMEKRPPAFTGK
jgi:enoyl-CoA hydratase/carnithine racemase